MGLFQVKTAFQNDIHLIEKNFTLEGFSKEQIKKKKKLSRWRSDIDVIKQWTRC